MRAFCYASGRIEFGDHTPEGALPIALGLSSQLRNFISARAKHAYDGKTLLVPGVPEAPHQFGAMRALERWLDLIRPHAPRAVKVF